jgi:hypothetical protein
MLTIISFVRKRQAFTTASTALLRLAHCDTDQANIPITMRRQDRCVQISQLFLVRILNPDIARNELASVQRAALATGTVTNHSVVETCEFSHAIQRRKSHSRTNIFFLK